MDVVKHNTVMLMSDGIFMVLQDDGAKDLDWKGELEWNLTDLWAWMN